MAGRNDEDDDETLIAALHPDDGDKTIDQGDGDATLVAAPLPRFAPRGPLPSAAMLPLPPRMPMRTPAPEAGAPPRTAPPPPRARPAPPPPVQTRRPPPHVQQDDSLDRRALPFAVGTQAPITTRPPPADVQSMNRTQEMPRPSYGKVAPQPAPRSVPAPPPPAPPPPVMQASATRSAPPPAVQPRAVQPSVAPTQEGTQEGTQESAQESVAVGLGDGTPLFVLRFLLVCGVVTALGLMALLYLEL